MIWKNIYKLLNNAVFRKTIENVGKHRDMKFVTTDPTKNYLVSEPNSLSPIFWQFIRNKNEKNKDTDT